MRKQRKPLSLIFFFLLLVQFVHPEEKKSFWSRFSLKVTGGWGPDIPIGDVNDSLESFNNNTVFENHRKANSNRITGEIKTLDGGISHWEAELRFDLTPRIGFGLATSVPIHKRNESSVTYVLRGWAGDQIMTWTFKPEIKVSYPIRLSAYYTLSFIRRMNISLGVGAGFYSAKINFPLIYMEFPAPEGSYDLLTFDIMAKRNFALGIHGNIVLEYFFADRLALVAEFQQRHVNMDGFKGTHKLISVHNINETRGTLYYFSMFDPSIGTGYSNLGIFEQPPDRSGRYIRDLREAVLNLSGYSLRIGIRMRLF